MRARAAIAVATAGLLLPATASAAPTTAVMKNKPGHTRVTRAYAKELADYAQRRYPTAAHCAGRVRVTFNSKTLPLEPTSKIRYNGAANVETCRIRIAPIRNPRLHCAVTVHEFGHLAGHEHSDDRWDPMYHRSNAADPGCARFVRRWERSR